MSKLQRYAKAIAALVGAVATWLAAWLPNDGVARWLGGVVALLTTLSVYAIPNKPAQVLPTTPPTNRL